MKLLTTLLAAFVALVPVAARAQRSTRFTQATLVLTQTSTCMNSDSLNLGIALDASAGIDVTGRPGSSSTNGWFIDSLPATTTQSLTTISPAPPGSLPMSRNPFRTAL